MPSFAGGLNEVANDFGFQRDQYGVGQNITIERFGEIARRGGTRYLTAGTVGGTFQITGGFCWRQPTTHTYLVTTNGILYSGGTYTLPMVWTNKGAIGSSATYPSFAPFRDGTGEVCYIADGVGLRKITTALVHSAVAGTPALAQLAVYNQRLFGITGVDQTIHYSSLNNGDSCGVVSGTSGNAIVRTFGSQKLTGLVTLKNSLAMFHVSGISRFTGLTQDDIAIGAGSEGISVDTGTIAPRSIVAVDGSAYFLSERGAFRLTDDGIEALDTPTTPDNMIGELLSLPASTMANLHGVHDRAHSCIRWSTTSGVISYNYRRRVWVGRDYGTAFTNSTAMWDGIDAQGKPLVLTGNNDGHVWRIGDENLYRDDVAPDGTGGTTYQMFVTTRRFFGPAPGTQKSWATLYIFGSFILWGSATNINATVSWTTNLVEGTVTGLLRPSADIDGTESILIVPIGKLGHWIDIEFSDSTETDLRISRIEIEAFDYGRRRA